MSYKEKLAKERLKILYTNCDEKLFSSIIDASFSSGSDVNNFLDKKGNTRIWLMDCRKGLADTNNLQTAAEWFVSLLDKNNINQIVAKGYGAYLLVGSILVTSYTPLKAGIIRETIKEYDKGNVIEGDLDSSKPVLLIDDILNSGSSCISAIKSLNNNGFKKISAGFLMKFSLGLNGEVELHKRGIKNITYAMEVLKQ